MQEEWKPIPGFPGYEASSEGRIRNTKTGTIRRGTNNKGYLTLVIAQDGKMRHVRIHRLVAFAFHGFPEALDHVVNHIDKNKANNRPTNLEYVTQFQNTRHACGKNYDRPQPRSRRKVVMTRIRQRRVLLELSGSGKRPSPWFRKGRGWYVRIGGKQIMIGKTKEEADAFARSLGTKQHEPFTFVA